MNNSGDRQKKWIVAASELAKDPGAKVKCPGCGQAFLSIQDERVEVSHVDQRIFALLAVAKNGFSLTPR